MRKPIVLASSIVVCSRFTATVATRSRSRTREARKRSTWAAICGPQVNASSSNTRGIADVVEIAARTVAAEGNTPQHCRVSGLLAPEIAFEVNLPSAVERPART